MFTWPMAVPGVNRPPVTITLMTSAPSPAHAATAARASRAQDTVRPMAARCSARGGERGAGPD